MMSIQLDNGPTKIKGSFFNINFCNGPQNGCGIRWSPTASLFDGKININMIGDLSKGALLGELGRLSRARQLPENHPFVRDVLATSVILESSRSIPVECDGDVIGLTPCQFTKARNTIDVVVSPTLKSQSKAQSD